MINCVFLKITSKIIAYFGKRLDYSRFLENVAAACLHCQAVGSGPEVGSSGKVNALRLLRTGNVVLLDMGRYSRLLSEIFEEADYHIHAFEPSKAARSQFESGGCNIDTQTFMRDFFSFFADYGFHLYRITPFGGLQYLETYKESHEQFTTTNFIASARKLSQLS